MEIMQNREKCYNFSKTHENKIRKLNQKYEKLFVETQIQNNSTKLAIGKQHEEMRNLTITNIIVPSTIRCGRPRSPH